MHMSGSRRRVEAFFRGRTEGPSWVPPTVAFVGLVGLGLLTTVLGVADVPGSWLLWPARLAAFALVAFLLGWPRVLWTALPAVVLAAVASTATSLATAPAGADLQFEPWLAVLQVVQGVLLVGVVGVGGTAWLWDRIRRDEARVEPLRWAAALVAPSALLSGVALLAPADWNFFPLDWGYRSGGPTAVTTLAIGLGTALVLAWGLGRWRRSAGFTFVDRFLAAGLPLVLVEALLLPLIPLAVQGDPLVVQGEVSFGATIAVRSGLHGAGDAYVAAALAAGAAAALLPERYAEPEEGSEAVPGTSDPGR